MRRIFAAVVAVMLVLGACGGNEKDSGPHGKVKSRVEKAVLEVVTIEPEVPTAAYPMRALTGFKTPPESPVTLVYRWFVNGEELEDAETAVLPVGIHKRGDRVRCSVKSTAGGREVQSKLVTVANAAPVFTERDVSSFPVPGEFFHQVFASDPDGDNVTYHLISPLERGIRLDEKTGVVRWRVEAMPVPSPLEREESISSREEPDRAAEPFQPSPDEPEAEERSARVTLVFEARDGHGGVRRYSLELDLRSGRSIQPID